MKIIIKVANIFNKTPIELASYLSGKLLSFVIKISLNAVGEGFYVCKGARIKGGKYINIGDNFYSGELLWIEAIDNFRGFEYSPKIIIGNNVSLSQMVHIASTTSVTIGDDTLVGSKVHITDHAHGCYFGATQDTPITPPAGRKLSSGKSVLIGKNVWIADGVVVLPGVSIGDGSIIGANSVVTKNIPPNSLAVGTPAMVIKRFDYKLSRWIKC